MQSPKLNHEDIISALRTRDISFALLRRIFWRADLKIGSGWESLAEKLKPENKNFSTLAVLLENIYKEQIILGHRVISVFAKDDEDLIEMDWSALEKTITLAPSSQFSETYPLPLKNHALTSAPKDPTLVEVRKLNDTDRAFIFCSTRTYAASEPVTNDTVNQELSTYFGEFQKVIVVREYTYQAFDVVVVRPRLQRIEVRIDVKGKPSTEERILLVNHVLAATETYFPEMTPLIIKGALNLFPAIESMYRDKSEGHVTQMAFQTTSSSVKKELMRRKGENLRDEKYHAGGMDAVDGEIEPFQITVSWINLLTIKDDTNDIHLTMRGSFKDLLSANPVLLIGSIEGASSDTEFSRVINKLISHSG